MGPKGIPPFLPIIFTSHAQAAKLNTERRAQKTMDKVKAYELKLVKLF